MRIGVMLRSIDERGGIGVYARNIVGELLDHDPQNDYVLFYRTPAEMGSFGDRPNLAERLVGRGWPSPLWDQLAIPFACRREAVDVLFHPKFTVPLLAPCPSVMVVHGADWFMPDQARFYPRLDVLYVRMVMPWYFRKAALVLSVSELTSQNFRQVLPIAEDHVRTVYFAPARHFGRVEDPERRATVRGRYGLPERFLLTLTKVHGDERKNFAGVLEGYARYHAAAEEPLPLVVGGAGCEALRETHAIPDAGWGSAVRFPGWLDQADLPAIYSMAEAYLYPSNLEAFPIPITEAMSCGTPVVTSDVNGLREIAGDAALGVPPDDPEQIAAALLRVTGDTELRRSLRERGLAWVRRYSWDRCAAETLAALTEAGTRP